MPIPLAAAGIAASRRAALSAARTQERRARARARQRRARLARAAKGQAREIAEQDDRPYIFSPEGVAMLIFAILLDFAPPIIVLILDFFFGIGEVVSWIVDIFGTITLGLWIFLRSGEMTFGKKLTRYLKRRAPFIVAEYVPVFGEGPWWTLNVFLFLKK